MMNRRVPHMSIVTLNLNDLNVPLKIYRMAKWIKNSPIKFLLSSRDSPIT